MSPNCLTVSNRPVARIGNWNCWPVGTGSCPTCPAATWTFWLLIAFTTSTAVKPPRRQLVRIEPQPHGVIAFSKDGNVADAFNAEQLVAQVDRRVVAEVKLVISVIGGDQADRE